LVEWRLTWEPKYSEKTCPSATLSTTNPTWLDPGLTPGHRGGKPATNRLSYGAASLKPLVSLRLSYQAAHTNHLTLRVHTCGSRTLYKIFSILLSLQLEVFIRYMSISLLYIRKSESVNWWT
jgi:hypothetical protein